MTTGDLGTGARIGRYVVIERVGSGAMGVVYGAYDPELDRKVALKLLKPGQGVKEVARARLLREAKAMARLSHPNVVAVHDVGVFEDQVFLAMEFLNAGTIKSWLAEKQRSWREILAVFVAAGRGLAAAHAAGLVHRDFKPDNVLLDKDGRPRVVDFGIARQSSGAGDDDGGTPVDVAAQFREAIRESSGQLKPLLTLTKTGTWVGTPAYMAPEQFMGERGDEKSDQFSFCVALYEALYGERPFAGDDVLTLSVNVSQEQFNPLPKDRGVPTWIRRMLVRGVRSTPSLRWQSMAALIAALEDDPDVKLRRRVAVAGAVGLGAAILLGAWHMASSKRVEVDNEISRNIDEANRSTGAARAKLVEARDLRRRAFAAFDAMDREQGESLWRKTRAIVPAIDAGYDDAERRVEAAYMIDRSREQIRTQLADLRHEHLQFADDFRLESKTQVLLERLAAVDKDGRRRRAWDAPGELALTTTPRASRAALERYERDAATGRRTAKTIGPVDPGRGAANLPAGSYRLALEGPGLARVVFPFEIGRGQRLEIDLSLPAAAAVPDGFAYVPAGEFWFGDADELLRTQFLDTVPLHRRRSNAYLIARRETTYEEWIAFLNALPVEERSRRAPDLSTAARGSLRLLAVEDGWQLSFQPSNRRYSARVGDTIVYEGRKPQARLDWLRFPVTGISSADVQRYLGWLRSSGRMKNARLCTEVEWERAARGADERIFSHGDDLQPTDANFDLTYGRVPSAYGPDMVATHPDSRSPFDVDDLVGNALELASSSLKADELVIRGGGYYFGAASCRSTNREVVPSTFRDVVTGIRVCASP